MDQVAEKSRLAITTDISEQVVPISRGQASALFRVAQEALQNIVKHARADAASVRLVTDGRGAVLEIADNGRGFHRIRRSNVPNPRPISA